MLEGPTCHCKGSFNGQFELSVPVSGVLFDSPNPDVTIAAFVPEAVLVRPVKEARERVGVGLARVVRVRRLVRKGSVL